MPRLRELWGMTHHDSFCPDGEFLSWMGGQFLVSKLRILRQPLSLWTLLQAMLNAPADHFIHKDVEAIKDEGLRSVKIRAARNNDAPYFSFQLERAWVFLFDCIHKDGPDQARAHC